MSWEKVRLGDVLDYEQPTNYIVSSENYEDSFATPVLTAGKSFILGYTNEVNGIYTNLPAIIFDDFTTESKYVDFPFKVKSSAMKILTTNKNLADIRFMFYLLQPLNVSTSQHKRYWISKYTNLEVALPPLTVQKRIVEILNAADTLKRKDQALLKKYDELAQAIFIDMFGDPVKNDKGWEVKTIRSIALKISDGPFGSNLKTEHYSKEGVRVIRLKNIGVNSFNDDDSAFVNIQHYENVLKKYTCIQGDILIGTLGEPNLRACVFPSYLEKAVNKADCVMLRINPEICNQDYVSYFLNIPSFVESVANKLHGQTRTRISMGQVASLSILIPPKLLQDEFSALITNLKSQNELLISQNKSSNNFFKSLIQKAFKGELVK